VEAEASQVRQDRDNGTLATSWSAGEANVLYP
jgi:hypothetical protein